ncbi:MAG TPA: amidohydrolase family protein [Chloroflexota bacterium]|nr:amidohydrolase family protein [Chloroflexota bacterium]
MILDIHAHIVPERFPAANGRGNGRWPSMDHLESYADGESARANVMIAGENFRTVRDVCWSHTRRAEELQREGADAQAISPMPELLAYWFNPQDGLDMSRCVNEQIAKMCQAAPDRFYGLGMVPMQDPDLSAKELGPMKQAGLLGVELGSNILGKSLGEERFFGFFQEAEKLDMAIFVHALHPTFTDRFPANERTINAIGFPIDTALTIGSMIVSGLLERCPNLRLAFSHGGGTFTSYLPRLEHSWSGRWNGEPPGPAEGPAARMREMIPKSPTEYARKLYYDTLVFDRRLIRYLIDMVGISQIAVGTDFPFVPRERPVGKSLREVVTNPKEWELVSHQNAKRFLGIG